MAFDIGMLGGLMGGAGSLIGAFGGDPTQEALAKLQLLMGRQQMGFRSQLWPQLQAQLNNPGGFMAGQQRAIAPAMNQFATQASQRAGLDSGAAQGALAKYGLGLMNQGWMGRQSELMRLLAGMAG